MWGGGFESGKPQTRYWLSEERLLGPRVGVALDAAGWRQLNDQRDDAAGHMGDRHNANAPDLNVANEISWR